MTKEEVNTLTISELEELVTFNYCGDPCLKDDTVRKMINIRYSELNPPKCKYCNKHKHVNGNGWTCGNKSCEEKYRQAVYFKHPGMYLPLVNNIPEKYLDCTFENFEVDDESKNPITVCENFLFKPLQFLTLMGSVGCGKTHLLVGMINSIIKWFAIRPHEISFIYVPNLHIEIQKSKNFKNESISSIIEKLSNIRILALDDFGAGVITQENAEVMQIIINNRYSSGKNTLISSNFSINEIRSFYGSQIISRLNEGVLFNIELNDYRRNIKELALQQWDNI